MIWLTVSQRDACKTERDCAVFYAGADYDGHYRYNASSVANEYAQDCGKTTLDINMNKAGLAFPETQSREVGEELSKEKNLDMALTKTEIFGNAFHIFLKMVQALSNQNLAIILIVQEE
ncbi:hypothetical protein AGMMS49975_08310 [Clostridia bacterium]|nr:hypothetical protein AGMMS49975_08310 [Clostridia bacterium]